MAKTYVPTLRLVVNQAYRYMTRWQSLLSENLTPDQITALTSCITCLSALIDALGAEPITE